MLRRVFYSVPSRLIGHRLRLRLFDERLDIYLGGPNQFTLPGGRARPDGRHGHVIDYRPVIHALRAAMPERLACRITVELLALAHERACEADLASLIAVELVAGRLPDMALLRAHFLPDPAALPAITVSHPPLAAYENLGTLSLGDAA